MLDGQDIDIKLGGGFNPVPADKYTVQIADVNVVTQFNKYKGKDQDLLNYQFIILDDKPMPEEDESTRERYLWRRMSQSLNSRSNLFKFVKAVFGKDLDAEELKAFAEDPESIIGRQVDVMVEQNEGNDGVSIYNNIISFSITVKELETVEFTPQPKDFETESKPAITETTEDPLPPVAGLDDFPGEDAPEPDPDEVKKTAKTAKKKK